MTNPQQRMLEYFKDRAVSRNYAATAGVRAVEADTAQRLELPYANRSQGGIVYPYLSPLNREPHDTLMRIRFLGELPVDSNGNQVRYAQPNGSGVEAFFDANIDWPEVMRDPCICTAITEGEAKALYMNQHWRELKTVTIGLGGVWNFREKETGDLTPWLRMIRAARSRTGGEYMIMFDSDMATNPDIQRAGLKLAELLGIEVQGCGLVRARR